MRAGERRATDERVRMAIFELEKREPQSGVTSVQQIRPVGKTRADLKSIQRGLAKLIEATEHPFRPGAAKTLRELDCVSTAKLFVALDYCWQIGEALSAMKKAKVRR
jgi:hypothetical protein